MVFLTIVAGGVGARALRREPVPPARSVAAAKPAAPVPGSVPATAALPAATPAPAEPVSAEPPKKLARLEKKLEGDRPAPAPSGGKLELAIAPWGEVLIDGKRRGVSPPLRVVDLPPGAHTVEIRNSTFPAHVQEVKLKAGEAVRIRHRFK